MPLLYGEGSLAFQRLQLEIIRSSHDETIYAWTKENDMLSRSDKVIPILASSPQYFSGSGDIIRKLGVQRSPWTVIQHGLEVPLVADNHTGGVEVGLKTPLSRTQIADHIL